MSKSLTIIRGIYEANNLERRAHLVALNDWSGSMVKYKRIVEHAFQNMVNECTDSIGLRQGLEIAVCDFSTKVQFRDFAPTPHYLQPQPSFAGGGYTNLGAALNVTIDKTRERRAMQIDDGIEVVKSVCVVLSDGEATDFDAMETAREKIREVERFNEIEFIPLLIEGMNPRRLENIFDVAPIRVDALKFDVLFGALSRSMSQHSVAEIDSEHRVYETLLLEYDKPEEEEGE